MPIHINLLAEERAAEEMRRRDPVKRAIFIGISLVVVALLFGAWRAGAALLVKGKLATVQTLIDAKTNAYSHADSDLKKIALIKGRLTALEKLQQARFLQGNLMNALQHSTVDGVQLTHLRLDQSYNTVQNPKTKTVTITEKKLLHLDARDFSENPGDQVQVFKDTIAKNPYFQSVLGRTNAVQLTGPPSALQTDIGKPYVTFSLECRFPDITR